jgi:hypothetical protein
MSDEFSEPEFTEWDDEELARALNLDEDEEETKRQEAVENERELRRKVEFDKWKVSMAKASDCKFADNITAEDLKMFTFWEVTEPVWRSQSVGFLEALLQFDV